MAQTPAQIIQAKGGPSAFAAAIGVEPAYARSMKWRDKIPTTLWLQVATAFPDLTLEVLQKADEAAAPARKRKVAA